MFIPINLGTGPDTPGADTTYEAFAKVAAMAEELFGPVLQTQVAAGQTLALTLEHHGRTIVLAGAGATLSLNAAALGAGFCCKVINDSGAAFVLPTPAGASLRFDESGHTSISAGGSASIELYARGAALLAHVCGYTQ